MRYGSSPFGGVGDDVERVVNRLLGSPGIVVALGIAFIIHAAHLDDFANGPIGNFAASHPGSPIIHFLVLEFDKLLGLSIILPVFLELRAGLLPLLLVGGLVLLAPPMTIFAYGALAFAALLMFISRHIITRVVVFVAIILVMYFGMVDMGGKVIHATSNSTYVCPSGYTLRTNPTNYAVCRKTCTSGAYMATVYAPTNSSCTANGATGTCSVAGICTSQPVG